MYYSALRQLLCTIITLLLLSRFPYCFGANEYLRRVSKRAYPVPALVDVPRRKRLDPAKAVTKLREAVSTSKHGGRPDKKAKFFRHFKNHPDCQ